MTLDDVVGKLDDLILRLETFNSEYINRSNILINMIDNIDILIYILIVITIMIFMLRRVKII